MARLVRLLFALLLLSLAACQSIRENQARWHRTHDVPAGSMVSLERAVAFPADRANVYIQDGQVRPYGSVDLYSPHCELIVRDDISHARTVAPDTFEIYRSVQEINPIYGMQTSGSATFPGAGESRAMFQTTMYLRSKRQPHVYQLVCGHWVYASSDDYLTVAQIRAALGKLMVLRLPGR